MTCSFYKSNISLSGIVLVNCAGIKKYLYLNLALGWQFTKLECVKPHTPRRQHRYQAL